MNIKYLYRKKSRGVTPVIATVLLIALVVIAGIGVAIIIFGTLNTPAPMKVSVLSISDFETTDGNILIDQFTVTLENKERTHLRLETDAFALEYSNGTPISGWSMNIKHDEIFLLAGEIRDIPLICDPNLGQELIPKNDSIYIEITVFPKDSTSRRSAKIFRSDVLIIGDTYGPMLLEAQGISFVLTDAGLDINYTVVNYGSSDQELLLEFSSSSLESSIENPEELIFSINGVNKSSSSFTIGGYSSVLISNIEIFPPELAADSYLMFAFLWSERGSTLFASNTFVLTYQG